MCGGVFVVVVVAVFVLRFSVAAAAKKSAAYTSKDLAGLKVFHSADSFREGESVVLTMKDAAILDEKGRWIVLPSTFFRLRIACACLCPTAERGQQHL